ncbi:UNVERIFIED_CONTAM: hypothetical protein PYX00_011668 [Menopon gallinae]|uniref:Ribonuclease n=1 Tax=Menopon gallinae TaxID=328185 RepID=A0AAW2H898_9NEOP
MQNIFFKRLGIIDGDVVVGIDEAGRGPVLGYMVYGALVASEGSAQLAGFSDSKTMSAQSRERCFGEIEANMSFAYKAIHPQQLTERMACHGTNLNEISFETVFDILDEIHRSYSVKAVFVDTVGDAAKFRAMLEARYRTRFVVEARADYRKMLNPVFGYPSIVRFSWATVDEFLPRKKAPRMRGMFDGFYLSDG